MTACADDAKQPWKTLKFDLFGLHATLMVKTRKALYYKSGGSRCRLPDHISAANQPRPH
jgi:hypothetical protein